MRIALGHQARVGKDTFAARMAANMPTMSLAFADDLYTVAGGVQAAIGVPQVKNPRLLQLLGQGLREIYGTGLWVDRVVTKVEGVNTNIVVTDMRYVEEMDALKAAGFTTVRILRPGRPIDRDPTHISEIALLEAEFDYTIINDGTETEYLRAVDDLLCLLARRD